MKNVRLVAPVCTLSGYGVHARQIASFLTKKHHAGQITLSIHATNWGATPWDTSSKDFKTFVPFFGKKPNIDVSIQLGLPNEWVQDCPVNIGMTAGNESDRWSEKWLLAAESMTSIIVPSAHAAMPLLVAKPELASKVHVVPESFSEAFLEPADVTEKIVLDRDFYFLLVGQITGDPQCDRKNIMRTIRWIARHFADNPSVGIVVKLNSGRDTVFDRRNTLHQLQHNLKDIPAGCQIKLVHGRLTDQEMSGLYRHPKIKALVTSTHGEGFGLPILEAAVCGLPVIATNWSAHTEFLKLGKFIDLPYELKKIPQERIDGMIQIPGAKWADVSANHLLARCEKVFSKYDTPKKWAEELSVILTEKYSTSSIESMYESTLKDFL